MKFTKPNQKFTNQLFSRRRILRGAGLAVALPFLPSIAPRPARAAGAPKRIVFWWMPDGVMTASPGAGAGGEDFNAEPGNWFPATNDFLAPGLQFPMLSAPLMAVKNDILMMRGVDVGITRAAGCPHDIAPRFNLTAGGSESIDMIIGKTMSTRFKQMHFGVGTWNISRADTRIHYTNNAPIQPVNDPNRMFQNLFGDPTQVAAPSVDPQLLAIQLRKKSVWDSVLRELQDVRGKVSPLDKQHLEFYEESVRESERALGNLNEAMAAEVAPACKTPMVDLASIRDVTIWNAEASGGSLKNFDKVAAVQIKLLTLALQCDQTRVATIMFESGRSGQRYDFMRATDYNHGYAHRYYRSPATTTEFQNITIWRAKLFADWVKTLAGVPDFGGQKMLDNMVVVHTSELSTPGHSYKSLPIVLAGRLGGAIRTGRLVDYRATGREIQTSLYLTLARRMGVPIERFPLAGGPHAKSNDVNGLV